MFRWSSPLPNKSIYTLTWTIAEEFGGVTNAAIQRTNAFARSGQRRVEFLTLSPKMDPNARSDELKRAGKLHKRVTVRNIWHELCDFTDKDLKKMTGNINEVITVPNARHLPYEGLLYAEKTDKNGAVVQTDYFRDDGSLFASDMLKPKLQGEKRGRLITLFSSIGAQLAQWSNISEFYYSWLDNLIHGKDAVLITDSAGIGGRMRNYDRPNVVKAQVQHNCHLATAAGRIDGPLSARWKNILVNSDKYDFLALLTDREREDLTHTQLDPGNLITIPNMFRGSKVKRLQPRSKYQGILVSRLVAAKQIDHAIRAVAATRSARLDIYGSGLAKTQQRLEGLVDSLHVGDRIVRRGYDPLANERFRDASYSILTSRSEGQGLVLLESMAAGCIPVAYDVRYGPSDIITHGVNGFLVTPGNIRELAATIEHVISMPDKELNTMRSAAIARADDFAPDNIVRVWADAIHTAMNKKMLSNNRGGAAKLLSVSVDSETLTIEATVTGIRAPIDWAAIAWVGRDQNIYGRVRGHVSEDVATVISGTVPVDRLVQGLDEVFAVYVDVASGGTLNRLKLCCRDDHFPRSQELTLFRSDQSVFSISTVDSAK